MIKVNLLRNMGVESAPAAASMGAIGIVSVDHQKVAALKIVVLLAIPIALYIYETMNMSALKETMAGVQAQIAAVNQKKASFGDAGPKVEKNRLDKEKIDKHLSTIRGLARGRLREVKALATLQRNIPSQVWLTSLKFNQNVIQMEGYSNTEEGVTLFFDFLQTPGGYFTNFDPKSRAQETVNGSRAIRFVVESRIGREDER